MHHNCDMCLQLTNSPTGAPLRVAASSNPSLKRSANGTQPLEASSVQWKILVSTTGYPMRIPDRTEPSSFITIQSKQVLL